MWARFIRKLEIWLCGFTKPTQEELVLAIVLHTCGLELSRDEYVELAGMRGTCGPFQLRGNGLPVFNYTVFEKTIMEFVKIRVEISRPNSIRYIATIESTTAPKRNGEVVPVKDKYKEPFEQLALHLFRYFPFHRKVDGMRSNK